MKHQAANIKIDNRVTEIVHAIKIEVLLKLLTVRSNVIVYNIISKLKLNYHNTWVHTGV